MTVRRKLTILTMAAGFTAAAIAGIGSVGLQEQPAHGNPAANSDTGAATDSTTDSRTGIDPALWEGGKAKMPAGDENDRYTRLTDEDFDIVAKELGVETAAIKAVVRIEAGASLKGFWAPGVPIVNFDRSMYKIYGKKAVNKAGDKNAKVPPGLKGFPLKRWTALTKMRRINREGADMSTFWGMFQIGGFCYKSCGCKSIGEFVELMSRSEFDQLELFAAFVANTGYVDYIRRKDWAGFARRYNGASYASKGYHTRMAREYAKYKNE